MHKIKRIKYSKTIPLNFIFDIIADCFFNAIEKKCFINSNIPFFKIITLFHFFVNTQKLIQTTYFVN
jgi:hypothetical protein